MRQHDGRRMPIDTFQPALALAARGAAYRRKAVEWAIIIGTVFIAFWPSVAGDFIWDDVEYLLAPREARELSLASIMWAFSTHSMLAGHYHPLTWLSWMVDFQLAGGPDPRQFHLTNIALHAAHCIVLLSLFRALLALRGIQDAAWISLLGVLVYAVHPLRVESVAWITERRDVLSGIFFAASLLAYLRAKNPEHSRVYSNLAFALFVVSLLCKAWAITLPVLLFIIDFIVTPKNHVSDKPMAWLRSRIHYFAISAVFVLIGVFAAFQIGALVPVTELSLAKRILQASFAWWGYLGMTVWPTGLAPYYSWMGVDFHSWPFVLAAAGVAIVMLIGTLNFPRHRAIAASILAYSFLLAPVLGFAQSGPQSMADRYTYLAILPFHALLTGGVIVWIGRSGFRQRIAACGGLLLVGLLCLQTFRQSAIWLSNETMWARVVETNPLDPVARQTRAMHAASRGNFDLALEDLQVAQTLTPSSSAPGINVAMVLQSMGQTQEALEKLDRMRTAAPADRDIREARVSALRALGKHDDALAELESLVADDPADARSWFSLGSLHHQLLQLDKAMDSLNRAAKLDPGNANTLLERGSLHARLGNLQAAQQDIQQALDVSAANWHGENTARTWLQQIRQAQVPAAN